MRRQEIARKFDEIVTFAGVERFVDTPVKRYSSGMSVRLAFAVAAHLEPEILLVDEVLAVGDAEFRRRCLGRMQDLGETGRTIVFVSHNMQAITQLCDRSILLDQGSIELDGPSSDVVRRYLEEHAGAAARAQLAAAGERARGRPRAHSLGPCRGCTGRARRGGRRQAAGRDRARPDDPAPRRGRHHAEDQARRRSGAGRVQRHRHRPAVAPSRLRPGTMSSRRGSRNLLNEGLVNVGVSVVKLAVKFHHHAGVHDAVSFHVRDPGEGDSSRGHYLGSWAVRPLIEWTLRRAVAAGADPSVLFLYRDSPLRRQPSARRPARLSASLFGLDELAAADGGRPASAPDRRRPGYRQYGRPAHSHGGRLQRRLRRRAEEPPGIGRGRRLLDGGHGRHPARAASARAPGPPVRRSSTRASGSLDRISRIRGARRRDVCTATPSRPPAL